MERARRARPVRFDRDVYPYIATKTSRQVRGESFDLVRLKRRQQHEPRHAEPGNLSDQQFKKGRAVDEEKGLGRVPGQIAEAAAQPAA